MSRDFFDENADLKHLAFDYLRGDLDDAMSREIEEAMIESAEFADYVTRLDALISSSRKADAEESELDADALFRRIAGAIEEKVESEAGRPAVVLHFPVPETEHVVEEEPPPLDASWIRWAAVAAIVLAMVGAALVFGIQNTPVEEIRTEKGVAHMGENAPATSAPSTPEPVRSTFSLAGLGEVETPAPGVNLFATDTSEWSLVGEGVERTVELRKGTVLVEFLPDGVDALKVHAREFSIDVVGTVFYASEEEGRVGVITGKVLVTPRVGEPVVIGSGEEWQRDQGVRRMDAVTTGEAESKVNVDAHIDALARARARKSEAIERVRPQRAEEAPTPAETMASRQDANAAIRAGDYRKAARILEDVVSRLPANDPAAGSIRLDLSRIYISNLKQPRRATVHLKRFVQSRPADPATPSARRELCRIVEEIGSTDPECAR